MITAIPCTIMVGLIRTPVHIMASKIAMLQESTAENRPGCYVHLVGLEKPIFVEETAHLILSSCHD